MGGFATELICCLGICFCGSEELLMFEVGEPPATTEYSECVDLALASNSIM